MTRARLISLGSICLAVAAGLFALAAFGRADVPLEEARVSVSVAPALRGATRVDVRPLGSVEARTHEAPLRLTLGIEQVEVGGIKDLAERGLPNGSRLEEVQDRLVTAAVLAGARGLGIGLLLAAGVAWLATRRRRDALLAPTALLVLALGVSGAAAGTFDLTAFRQPTYHGAMAYAPTLVAAVQKRVDSVSHLRRQLASAVEDVAGYYAEPQDFASGGSMKGTVRVLDVSDLHLDPVGTSLVTRLAAEFDASFVIDTGDVNTFGSAVEAGAVAEMVDTSLPTVFVPGNHDSPDVVAAVSGLKGVHVADSSIVELAGVRVFGVPDPASRGWSLDADPKATVKAAEEAADLLRARLASGEATPQIVAVHDPRMAEAFRGLAPLVVAGHTHSAGLESEDGTWELNAGTTGGVVFGGRARPNVAHTAAVLYYTAELPRRLIAIDQIALDGRTRETSLTRTVIDPDLLP